MDCFTLLDRGRATKPQPVYILHGDEDFLKRQALSLIQQVVLDSEDNAFGLSTHSGDKATFAPVFDELDTMPFLSLRRLVVIENADPFVTENRPALEKYVAEPAARGVLVLDVKNWPSTTRLAKLVSSNA